MANSDTELPICEGCQKPIEGVPFVVKTWAADLREHWHTTCFVRDHIALLPCDERDSNMLAMESGKE